MTDRHPVVVRYLRTQRLVRRFAWVAAAVLAFMAVAVILLAVVTVGAA